jgi:hypothetical protein
VSSTVRPFNVLICSAGRWVVRRSWHRARVIAIPPWTGRSLIRHGALAGRRLARCRVALVLLNEASSVTWESKFGHGVSSPVDGIVSWTLALATSMRSWPTREGVDAWAHATMPKSMGTAGPSSRD